MILIKMGSSLSFLEKTLVNLFTPFDVLMELSGKKGFKPYYIKLNAKTRYDKTKAIFYAKIDKTEHLIRIKNDNFGLIPYKVKDVCNKNICGRIRLWVAYRH